MDRNSIRIYQFKKLFVFGRVFNHLRDLFPIQVFLYSREKIFCVTLNTLRKSCFRKAYKICVALKERSFFASHFQFLWRGLEFSEHTWYINEAALILKNCILSKWGTSGQFFDNCLASILKTITDKDHLNLIAWNYVKFLLLG